MSVRARLRHPVTGRRFWLRASSHRELEAYIHRVDTLRTELKLGMRSAEEIDRQIRHLLHGPVTLERAARSYLERPGLAPNTRRRVRSLIETHAGAAGHFGVLLGLPLSSLDGPRLAHWIEQLRRAGLHDTTIATIWRSGLCAVASHAAERGWIGALPWGNWHPRLSSTPKRVGEAARNVEELARLLAAAHALDEQAWNVVARDRLAQRLSASAWSIEAMIGAAALLALRQGELAGLRWDEIELGPPVRVRIARQWEDAPLKGNRAPVWIEADQALGEILVMHSERLSAAGLYEARGPVFPDPARSTPQRPRAYTGGEVLARLKLRAAVERAQLPSVGAWSAHGLRATFVTLEAAACGDLRAVASRSRHGSITSLARYLRALSRSRDPAPPGFRFLPGSQPGGAGVPLLGGAADERDPKETPP